MSWSYTPAWAVGNPFGPLANDGMYYYMDKRDQRVGPFMTYENAKAHMEAHE